MTMKQVMKSAMILAMLVLALALLTGCGKQDEENRIPNGAQICAKCAGSGVCQVCDGDGGLELTEMLGGWRKCSFCLRNKPGACYTCKGLGYVMPRR